jgi:indolepyruvate ferredoxin oxidoreductase
MVPVSHAALMSAIELNAVAVPMNKQAFLWGRRAACDRQAVERLAQPAAVIPLKPENLDESIATRVQFLTAYQDAAYAERYRRLVERVREAEARVTGTAQSTRLSEAVARNYFKLLAYKDEYEVARLYSDPAFWARVGATFEGDFTVRFHLAPPLLARPDPVTGKLRKKAFGPATLKVFRVLAKLKRLRGTRLDPFGYSAERKRERALIAEYERDVAELLAGLSFLRLPQAVAIASLPDQIRGFGHVKAHKLREAAARREQLLAAWHKPTDARRDAAARAA